MAEWSDHPHRLVFNGYEREFFDISQLGLALGRRPSSIRHWERTGIIPKSRFRGPNKIRLYTRYQVTEMARIAQEERIDDLARENLRFSNTRFVERVALLFQGDPFGPQPEQSYTAEQAEIINRTGA